MSQPDSILRLPAVLERTGLSRTEIYRRMRRGDFPASISLGIRAIGFSAAAVDRWVEERKIAHHPKPPKVAA